MNSTTTFQKKLPQNSNTYNQCMSDCKVFTEKVSLSKVNELLANRELNTEYFDILQSYKKLIKYNKVKVVYSQNYKDIGRHYAKDNGCRTLQNFPRELRNTLACDNYFDIDMINALPTILKEECNRKEIKCKYLKKFIKYRDDKLQELMTEFSCDKATAKTLPHRLINGGGFDSWIRDNNLDEDCEMPEFWNNFKQELNTIYKSLYKLKYDKYEVVLDKKDTINEIARLVSISIQDIENDILFCAIEYLEENGFSVGTPIYDGFLVEKHELIDNDLLSDMSNHIHKELGYEVFWAIKPMDEQIVIQENNDGDDWNFDEEKSFVYDASYCMMIVGDSQSQTYQRRKKYVEHFLVETFHPENLYHMTNYRLSYITTYKRTALVERLEDTESGIISPLTGRHLSFTEVWLKDHNKRKEQSYTWIPSNPTNNHHLNNIVPDHFNTFTGFNPKINSPYNPDATKILDLWKQVVFNLCGGDDYCFHYYICYLAQMIQNPSNRPPIAIGFKSKQGEGKGTHLACISRILGEDHYYSSEDMENFFGKHAEAFPKRILVNIDEVNGSHNYINSIKTKITEPYTILNAKNMRPIKVRNFARIIFTMNNMNISFDMGSEERRFVFFEGNGKNLEFNKMNGGWDRIIKHWESDEHTSALFNFLNNYNIDIDIFNKHTRPITDLYKTLLYKNKPYICSFMEQFLTGCKWREYDPYTLNYEEQTEPVMEQDDQFDNVINLKATQFRKDVNEFIKSNGMDFSVSQQKLFPEIKNFGLPITYQNKRGNNYYIFNPSNVYKYMVDKKWIESELLEQKQEEIQYGDYDESLFLK